jgi:ectoine hydroxylase-related dioxygenase (phytanoyl-CoA dioxygenase family)
MCRPTYLIGLLGALMTSSRPDVCTSFSVSSRLSVRRFAKLKLSSVVAEDTQGNAPLKRRFMQMTEEEDRILKDNGDREAKLMASSQAPLVAHKVKIAAVSSGGRGFGSKSIQQTSEAASDVLTYAKAYAKVLRKDGIVRIDNILPEALADSLKEYLVDLRARGTSDIENGIILDSQERFADVLLNQNRCDLKIPLGPQPVNRALAYILHQTAIRTLVEYVFDSYGGNGKDATLYELNCFMSNQGARRQLVHADNVCVEKGLLSEAEPIMLTCFIALQDTDISMGPTTWILGTHNREAHAEFYGTGRTGTEGESSKDKLLRTRKKVVGTLAKGACAIFDPRTLHCAGANECQDPNMTRALFYISFKNPRVDHPGCPSCSGYGIADAELTLQELSDELATQSSGKPSRRLDFVASFPSIN